MSIEREADFIVVGSGLTGVQAAQTLLEAGASVLMVDAGVTANADSQPPPERSFLDLRSSDPSQHRYFLGRGLEAVLTPAGSAGSQLTPPRRFVVDEVERWLPVESHSFCPVESLARGGLGNAWGAGCYFLCVDDLRSAGLPPAEIHAGYQVVADRIGVQGSDDDATPFCGGDIRGLEPAMNMDEGMESLYARYRRARARVLADGITIGRPALAVLTRARDGRSPVDYRNMDFYSDAGGTAYRPPVTLAALAKHPRFAYRGGVVVTRFSEGDERVEVEGLSRDGEDATPVSFRGRKLVLCAGPLGSMRVVARSQGGMDRRFPILTNPCDYLLGWQPARVGRPLGPKTSSFAQLAIFYRPQDADGLVWSGGSLYSFQALMLFRLAREAPVALSLSREIFQLLQTSLVMIGMTYPDWPRDENFLVLRPSGRGPIGDELYAQYSLSDRQVEIRARTLRAVRKNLGRIGCWVLSAVQGRNGFSSHYAGTLPFATRETAFSLAPDGRLYGTRAVYVADASGFNYLPTQGLTWTLMANAHRTAERALER